MEINYRLVILGGFILFLLPHLITTFFPPALPAIILILLIVLGISGIILIGYGSIKYYQLQSKVIVLEDERTEKIGYRIGTYTFFITICFTFLITFLAQQKIIDISFIQFYWIILFQIALTMILLNWYLQKRKKKKGETQ